MSTFFWPIERDSSWWKDYDGTWTKAKRYDEILSEDIDLSGLLADGDSVSTATWTSKGITINSSSLSSNVATLVVTGAGEAECDIVTVNGETHQILVRFIAELSEDRDYDD